VLVYSMIRSWHQGYWFIALTDWSFMLETCYLWSVTHVTVRAMCRIQEAAKQHPEGGSPAPERLPWYVSLVWLLWSTVMPACMLVTVVFWTVLDSFWDAKQVTWSTLCVHLFNTLLLLLELFVSRNVFYLKHVGALYAYGFAYLFWSLIDFWAKIGNGVGCNNYANPHDCPIYSVLDWHRTPRTLMWVVAILILAAFCALAVWALVHLRNACAAWLQRRLCVREKQASSVEEQEESTVQPA